MFNDQLLFYDLDKTSWPLLLRKLRTKYTSENQYIVYCHIQKLLQTYKRWFFSKSIFFPFFIKVSWPWTLHNKNKISDYVRKVYNFRARSLGFMWPQSRKSIFSLYFGVNSFVTWSFPEKEIQNETW